MSCIECATVISRWPWGEIPELKKPRPRHSRKVGGVGMSSLMAFGFEKPALLSFFFLGACLVVIF
ncbi:MAG TPA: hypothetical protein VJ801_10240 [Polyangia bacterium]|nr:hypothetical protein [Polyangia bacterium]